MSVEGQETHGDLQQQVCEQHDEVLSEFECHAMRLLYMDGYGAKKTLPMIMQIDDTRVYEHLNGECWHSPFPIPPAGDIDD